MIRDLLPEELPRILEIETLCYPRPWSERMFRSEFENPMGVRAAWAEEERLVGYVFGWVIFEDLHVNNVAVDPSSRRKGLGRALMEELFARSRALGASRASLEVRPSNAAARGLYERMEFRQIAVRKGYYEDTGEDGLILARRI